MAENYLGKILVVDDEVELKNALVEALTSQNFEVAGFTSAREALKALRHEDFDVLLSDLMMPEMGGIPLVRAALDIDPFLIAIIMTGQGTIQTAVDAMKAGTFDYVLKPFRLQAVMPVLTRAINTRRLRLENLQLRETVAIYELCQTIAFTLDPQTIISKLADAALQQTQAEEVSVLLPAGHGEELYVAAVRGENRQRLLGERVPLRESISGWVARKREGLLLDGEIKDERFHVLWPHPEIRSAISVPMQVAGKLIGTININAIKRARPFTLGQMKALTILASTAAAALESASLYTKVQQAEADYRSIFENAVEGIFRSTADGRFITVNPAVARILGYQSPEEIVESVTDIRRQLYVDAEDRVRSAKLQQDGSVLHGFEFEGLRKNGEKIWLSVNRRAVHNENGELRYFEGSIEDITERKRAEQTLRELAKSKAESLALLDTLLSTAPIGFAFHDRDLVFQRINQSLAAINGLPVEEHLGRKLSDVLPEMSATLEPLLLRVLETGEPVINLELSGETPADRNRKHHWLVSFYPVRLEAGDILGVGVLVSDVTERKQAEEALRASEERYRDLVENAHDIIYSHDLEGNYTSMNKAGEVITGYTVEEALKMNLAATVAPEYLPAARDMIQRKLAGERVTAYEMEILAKDGKRISVEANTKLVYENGVAVGVQGIARDITERKELEEQLRQSQKMEAIGRLAGGVAHDFNNLLTAINGYSTLALQRLDESSSIRPYLEEVKKAGDRAANLTRQLLAFGRKQILQPLPLDLNSIVADMNKMLRRLIGEDIQLTANLALDLRKIQADPGQIEQVLVNLVVNARDAMPAGGKLIIETANITFDGGYVGRHVGAKPGNYVMLAVSDTGVGMDEATLARIFEPFFTTKPKDKGTGLGLSTVYGIIKQSGGNIWVYSEVNKGTTFKVYLPQLSSDAPGQPDVAANDEEIAGGSETILLVEDEDVVRGLATSILEGAGYKVIVARSGGEAIDLCATLTEQIDLLLTDVVMPKLSGKELAEQLTGALPKLKVLYMSGYTDDAIVHHGVLDSTVEFIQKPFTPVALGNKVRRVLDAPNGGRRTRT